MSLIPQANEIYKHFKGNLYRIITIAEHSETGEDMVIYQGLYGEYKVYARPLAMFMEKVDREKYPDVAQEYRFELQGQPVAEVLQPGVKSDCVAQEPAEAVAAEGSSDMEEAPAEDGLDPLLVAFLDADSYEERLNALAGVHHRITDEMITTMAIACDVEVAEGSLEERYESLRNCLLTLERYECNRLR